MKIALLSRNRKLYSSRRIIEAAEARGHEVVVIDVLRAYMNVNSRKPSIHYKGATVEGVDAVIPRIGDCLWYRGTASVRNDGCGIDQ
jgi:ribosomal protein S6--L-glutamate ligase